MKSILISALLLIPILSCPKPNPPVEGYDCSNPSKLRGIVSVANALANKYIVVLKSKTSNIQPLVSVEGVTKTRIFSRSFAAQIAEKSLSKILSDPNVAYIQQDGIKSIKPLSGVEALGSWGLDRVDQRDLPLDGKYIPDSDGSNVNVAVVDTGVTNIPSEFEGRLSTDCFSAVNNSCLDEHGHGTHVAGTVGSKTYGVAKKVNLFASRVLDASGSGSDSDVIAGIEWVINKKQADSSKDWVISMSLGGSPAPALDQSVCDAISVGISVVVAAGNESQNADKSSPARVVQAITVGAVDKTDKQAYFSNYGSLVDIQAPGVDITSTQPGGGTATWSGTSMATPHVSGYASLYLSKHPGLSPQAVRDALITSASVDKLSNLGPGSQNLLLYVKE